MSSSSGCDCAVLGGGLIGLAVAWRAALGGLSVHLADPDPGAGASSAAAGMLAPVTEAHYGEERLLDLNLRSAQLYPSFADELSRFTDLPTGYDTRGTLAVAFDRDDRAVLAETAAYHRKLDLESTPLTGREARALEPMLAPGVQAALLVEHDHQVDNRLLHRALLAAAVRAGVRIHRSAAEIVVEDGRARGLRLESGEVLATDQVVLAAGCWSSETPGLPPGALPRIRPVRGQILRLAMGTQPLLARTIRAMVRGRYVYLVPRAHGELVIGATTDELGFDTSVTSGGVYELLRDAHEVVPGITELALVESRTGLRPGSPDNAPLLGQTALPGLIAATGHYRNGVLLTPVTADAIASLLIDGTIPGYAVPFSPQRFGGPSCA
ncbi:glycine oxidase ThiO [Actinospica sp. MGRD01-02]|uniref:glycine oxidase n=1 Tax=Actinospica acidithermotolerans TaxID=2828514 RepID=A0A941E545_9ACTN|nr:glycine oxidase ThiO [Actinospica acidithermotolerans]MBR7826475.1 glycine oxidase ThiO [Actinospica acidithermotolerans]